MRSPVQVNCSVVVAGPSGNAPTEAERVLTLMNLETSASDVLPFTRSAQHDC